MEIMKYLLGLAFVSLAVLSDYRTFKIRNKLTLWFLILGFIFNLSVYGLAGAKDAVFGSLVPLVLFPLFALKMLGAGDIKAFCALGSILGFAEGTYTMMFSFIAGGIIALGFLCLRKNAVARFKSFWLYVKLCLYNRKLLPYDVFTDPEGKFRFAYGICGGFIFTMLNNSYRLL